MALTILMLVFHMHRAQALEFKDIKVGMTVQIAQNFVVNRLHADGNLLCKEAGKALFPRVTVGPLPGADVPVQYFTVTSVTSDVLGFEVAMRSDQMPCSCIFSLEQRPAHFGGAGSDFEMLAPASAEEMEQVPAIPTSCKNMPTWVTSL